MLVRLHDRLPLGAKADVNLELISSGQDLSADPAYQQSERKKGILRWEVSVPAQAVGPDAFAFEFQYNLEYDKQMTVASLTHPGR